MRIQKNIMRALVRLASPDRKPSMYTHQLQNVRSAYRVCSEAAGRQKSNPSTTFFFGQVFFSRSIQIYVRWIHIIFQPCGPHQQLWEISSPLQSIGVFVSQENDVFFPLGDVASYAILICCIKIEINK